MVYTPIIYHFLDTVTSPYMLQHASKSPHISVRVKFDVGAIFRVLLNATTRRLVRLCHELSIGVPL
jgi:hypothetical protein